MITIHAERNGMTEVVEFAGTETELLAVLALARGVLSLPIGQTGALEHVFIKLPK